MEEEKPVVIKSSFNALVNAQLVIEKLRVQSQVRQTHLKLKGKHDPETDELHQRIKALEVYVDDRIAKLLKSHPAYNWFSRVKGIGGENIGKVIGQVRIKPEYDVEGNELPYANTISALWKFAGYSVENGMAPKRARGEIICYNSQLRSMCWRLGTSFMKAQGKYYKYYLKEKERYQQRYGNQGINIVPVTQLPKKDNKSYEPDDMIAKWHVHNQALRKMIKLFLSHLWLVWREAEGLPISKPYAIDQLKHDSFIDPWDMVDR